MDKREYKDLNDEGLKIINTAKREARLLTEAEQKRVKELDERLTGADPEEWLIETNSFGGPSPNDPDGRQSPEKRIFGKGGELRTGKFAELQQRSGIDPNDWGEWRDESEYFSVLASQRWDPRLTKRAQNEITGADGGFTVPAPLASQIFDTSLESEIIRPRARVFTMTSES